MIAIDTSSLVAFLKGDLGADTLPTKNALENCSLFLPPAVLTEILSTPNLSAHLVNTLVNLPLLEVKDGYWERAGEIRRLILKKGLKARLGDALIAQACLDHDVSIITRDSDFKNFQKLCKLKTIGL